jgi:TonB family protein
MTPLAQSISTALVQFIWQGILIASLLWLALFLLRNRSARVRYFVSCVALAAMLVLPVITAYSLYESGSSAAANPAVTLTIRAVWTGSVPAPSSLISTLVKLRPWVMWVWLAGVATLSFRLAWTAGQLAILRRLATLADSAIVSMTSRLAVKMGTKRPVRVLIGATSDGPSLAGWIRPAILLPAATLLNLTPDQLEAIVAHEIAHLYRYDDVVNIFQTFIETLLFYHPAMWWVSGRIRHERELCCDDLVVETCGDALCYARALTTLEKLRLATPRLALGATQGPLAYRIQRLVGSRPQEYLPSSLPGVLALCLAVAGVAINTNPAHGATAPLARVEYPEAARTQGIQGTVPVEVKIDATGKVKAARALGGPKELRAAAIEEAATAQFARAAAPVTRQVDVAFQLAPRVTNAQSPAPTATPDPATLATLAGIVTGVGGQPLSKSTVSLYPFPQPLYAAKPSGVTTSDHEGKFSFEGIAPGNYTLTAEHPGYLVGSYGAKRTTQLLIGYTAIPIAASQHVTGISMELIQYSIISGKVLDEDRDPLPHVTVQAMISRYVQGRRELTSIGVDRTDDQGEFKIPNMGPGQVYLNFLPPPPRPGLQKPGQAEQGYLNSYYPGATEFSMATPLTVMPGIDLPGITVMLQKGQTYHVRGTVTGDIPQGRPAIVQVFSGSEFIERTLGSSVVQNGSFDIGGLSPGSYTLGIIGANGRGEGGWLTTQHVDVTGGDIAVAMNIGPALNIVGQVKLEGPPAATGTGQPATVSLKGIQMTLLATGFGKPAITADDGTFTFTGVRPGKYTIGVAGMPPGGYLKAILSEGHDVIDGLEIKDGAPTLDVRIRMSAAELSGQVTVAADEQLNTAEMVLIPDPPQPQHPWLYKRQATNPGGQITIKNIAPGKYRLWAIEQIERFVQFDPDWFNVHQSRSIPVTFSESQHQSVTMKRTSVVQMAEDDKRAGH